MRISVLSGYRNYLSEGMMNMAFHLCEEMSKSHQVFHANARSSLFSKSFWLNIRNFHPQIIHIFLRPNITTLIMTKMLELYCHEAKIIISAFQPPLHYAFTRRLIPLLKPDLILTQSEESGEMFINSGCKVAFLPSGVDTVKFAPVSPEAKEKLREKYSVDKDSFVVLHVGPIKEARNLRILNAIQGQGNNQIVLVGSTSFEPEEKLHRSLQERGCLIWHTYFANLQELYGLSDCYLFPVKDRSFCIEFPLSVLEAMSCNLPVISTKFGALASVFEEGDGLFFAEGEEGLLRGIERVKSSEMPVRTRDKVLSYAWEKVAANLEKIYADVLRD
jgi:glycosyltransferase involved in cell wall biosynthesis